MKDQATDHELLEGIIRSDVPSYEAAYALYYPRVLSFVKGLLKDSFRSEDVAQNVFMKLWSGRVGLDASLSLRNYLFVLAKNEIINIFKSKSTTAITYSASLPDSRMCAPSAESSLECSEVSRTVARIVNSMPPRRREVFVLNRYQHKSIEEIADKMDLSPRTVEKHLELALKDLRRNFN